MKVDQKKMKVTESNISVPRWLFIAIVSAAFTLSGVITETRYQLSQQNETLMRLQTQTAGNSVALAPMKDQQKDIKELHKNIERIAKNQFLLCVKWELPCE